MVAPQTETKKLSAVDASAELGELADLVVLATIHAEQGKPLDPTEQRALLASAEWLDDLASIFRDPLDLPRSLQDLDRAGVMNHFVQMHPHALDAAAKQQAGERPLDELDETEQVVAALTSLRDSLRAFSEGRHSEPKLGLVRAVFEAIAQSMLVAVDEMMAPNPAGRWTTEFASFSNSSRIAAAG